MTKQDEQARLAERLAPLVGATFAEEDALRAEERRHRVVSRARPKVRNFAAARRQRTQRLVGISTTLAAAAALVLWLKPQAGPVDTTPPPLAQSTPLTLSIDGSTASVTHTSGRAQLESGQSYQLDGVTHVSTQSNSTARIEVPARAPQAGLKIAAGPHSELEVTRNSAKSGLELLHLSRGHLDVQVPKLKPGTTFTISTPSIRAVVIGTAFTLSVEPDQEKDSCLRVTEGVVRVETANVPSAELARVGAGQSWGCLEPVSDAASSPAPQEEAVPRKKRPQSQLPSAQAQPSGNLALETELLARAVRSNQREDYPAAKRELQKLLRDHPQSPLADEARRLLTRVQKAHSQGQQ